MDDKEFVPGESAVVASTTGRDVQLAGLHSDGLLAHWSLLPHQDGLPALATWDITTKEGKERLAVALTARSVTLWDLCEEKPVEIEVGELTACYGEFESEDKPGELVTGPILTLIGPAGAFHTCSEFAFRSLQQIANVIGQPPWHPSIRVMVSRLTSRKRRAYLHLQYVGRSVV